MHVTALLTLVVLASTRVYTKQWSIGREDQRHQRVAVLGAARPRADALVERFNARFDGVGIVRRDEARARSCAEIRVAHAPVVFRKQLVSGRQRLDCRFGTTCMGLSELGEIPGKAPSEVYKSRCTPLTVHCLYKCLAMLSKI